MTSPPTGPTPAPTPETPTPPALPARPTSTPIYDELLAEHYAGTVGSPAGSPTTGDEFEPPPPTASGP